jgi:hypothetical protein
MAIAPGRDRGIWKFLRVTAMCREVSRQMIPKLTNYSQKLDIIYNNRHHERPSCGDFTSH